MYLIQIIICISINNVNLWFYSFLIRENMLALEEGLWILTDFILLSEINFINWFFNLALEGIFEWWDLVVLCHCVPWHIVSIQVGAQLVVSVHIDFLLQLSANILVSIISSEMFVKFVVLSSWLSFCSSCFLLFVFSHHFFSLILLISHFSFLVEFDDQIMFLSNCQWHFSLFMFKI